MSNKPRSPKHTPPRRVKIKAEPDKRRVLLIYVILVLVTLIAYEPLRHNEFIAYDTDKYVTANPQVRMGLTSESIKWAFEIPLHQANALEHQANWHPLTWLSHMLDCQLFQLNPLGHHLMNLLFHLANTLLLFWILHKMTEALWCSSLVAALFALHPLHVESVAWVAERKDVLSGFFWMLTLTAYLWYAKRPGLKRYLPVFLALALGLMAKPMLVTLPFVLLLLDYWPLKRFSLGQTDVKITSPSSKPAGAGERRMKDEGGKVSIYRLILEKLPLFVLAAASCVITYLVQQVGGAVKSAESYPLITRLSNAAVSYVSYIINMVWPNRLAVLYPHPVDGLSPWQPIVCVLVLAAATAVIIYHARRRRYLAVGYLWYLGTLVPVIGLVQVGIQARADRYTYIPLIGIFIIIAWGAAELATQWRRLRIALPIGAGVLLVALMFTARWQLQYWRSTVTLFERALDVTENNYMMHYDLGRVLVEHNRSEEAIDHFGKALAIKNNYHRAHNNLGIMLAQRGNLKEAIDHFSQAIKYNPNNDNAQYNLGQALYMTGDVDGAVRHLQASLEIKKDSFETLNHLGWIRATSREAQFRNGPQALKLAQQACALTNYQNPETLSTLAAALAELGRFPEAMEAAQKAIDLHHASGQTKPADMVAAQLRLYQNNQPFRDR